MDDINDQSAYWNKVAAAKTFTHPADMPLIDQYVAKTAAILDYGCGYGRLTEEMFQHGFTNIAGVDTSIELVNRGKNNFPHLDLLHIQNTSTLPFEENSFDCILLFAVLTCIPANAAQIALIKTLYNKLKKGGILYISDYYLQNDRAEVGEYGFLESDSSNFGVFTLKEGATFRHHTREWINSLLQHFEIVTEKTVAVKTMNGNHATAFQLICRK